MSSVLSNNSNTSNSDTSSNTSLGARKSMNVIAKSSGSNENVSDELALLREFFDELKQQKYQNADANNENAPQSGGGDLQARFENNLRVTLECCVTREVAVKTTPGAKASNKSDLSVSILELLAKNVDSLALLDKESTRKHMASLMTKTFFDKLTKLYETSPDIVLRLTKSFIVILKKTIHHNLAVTNPLLQLIELSLKHNQFDIRAKSYECWTCLINNFALDREFFFKPKKFSLILMPLASKSRSYKDEASCRARAVSWLSLIEHINERLGSTYLENVVVPFLTYSFGFNSAPAIDESAISLHGSYKQEHDFQSLTQIGFESLLSFFCSGNMTRLPMECRKKIKYVNTNRDYQIAEGFGDLKSWLAMLRFYFQVVLAKPALFFDGMGAYIMWEKLSFLLEGTYDSETVDTEALFRLGCVFQSSMLDFLAEYTVPSNKSTEAAKTLNKYMTLLIKKVASSLKTNFRKYEGHISAEKLAKFIQKASSTLLSSEDEDEDYMDSFTTLVSLLESSGMSSVNLWTGLGMKYHDHLKHSKAKTIKLSADHFKAISTCLTFPFKNFRSFDIQENDTKLIVGACSNLSKQIAAAIKLAKFEISPNESFEKHLKSVNSWCSFLFNQLADKFEANTALLNPSAKLFDSSANLASMANATVDSSIKYLLIQSQYLVFIIQNVFEYEQVNQFQASQQADNIGSPLIAAKAKQAHNIMDKLGAKSASFQSMFSIFASLIELVQKQIKTFYGLIQSSLGHGHGHGHHHEYTKSPGPASSASGTPTTERGDKQAVQVFVNLVEAISGLFTRIKSHQVLSELLVNFAQPIELMSELNAISKSAAPESSAGGSGSGAPTTPSSAKKFASSQHRLASTGHSVLLQSTRRSSDLFDTFSMQIASYIQNHLSSIYHLHQFDSELLEVFEPIFYSFLKYSVKASLKQKTLQAWNSTFGKSTVSSLKYSARLEALFVEIREELLSAKSLGGAGSSHMQIAISLPGFRPDVEQSMTATMNTNDNDFVTMTTQIKSEEMIEASNITCCASTSADEHKKPMTPGAALKEALTNDSSMSMSVPVAHLVNHVPPPTTPTSVKAAAAGVAAQARPAPSQQVESTKTTSVFSFSPLGQAAASAMITTGLSQSASKLLQLRTPESNAHITLPSAKTSPRHLKNNSKRKLDLNVLIDQMPDKDFVEIKSSPKKSSRTPRSPGASLKAAAKDQSASTSASKTNGGSGAESSPLFKQPLTEHQKEMRKKRSFIPLEIQSVCTEIETTMDSQMSVTQDADDSCSNVLISDVAKKTNRSPNNSSGFASDLSFQTATANKSGGISFSKLMTKSFQDEHEKKEADKEASSDVEIIEAPPSAPVADEVKVVDTVKTAVAVQPQSIKFQSKINPKKQIELVELAESDQQNASSFKNVTVVNITTSSAPASVPAAKKAEVQTSTSATAVNDQSQAASSSPKEEILSSDDSIDPYEFVDAVEATPASQAVAPATEAKMDESLSEALTKKPPKSPSLRRSIRLCAADESEPALSQSAQSPPREKVKDVEELPEEVTADDQIRLKEKISSKSKLIKRLNEKRRLLLGSANLSTQPKRKPGRPSKNAEKAAAAQPIATSERVSSVQKLHDVDKDGPRYLTRINKKPGFFTKNKKGLKNKKSAGNQELINRYKLRRLIRTKVINTDDDKLTQKRESPEKKPEQAPEMLTPRTRRSISLAAQEKALQQETKAAEPAAAKPETPSKPVPAVETVVVVAQHESAVSSDDDDEDIPLSALKAKAAPVDEVKADEKEKEEKKVEEKTVVVVEEEKVAVEESASAKEVDESDVVLMETSGCATPKETPVATTTTTTTTAASAAKSVVTNTMQQQQVMMTSSPTPKMTNDAILQKLNGTPTSILKKRLTSHPHHGPGSAHKNLNEELASASTALPLVASAPGVLSCLANDTPSKRRVSFNEAVRVEEVEPYLCKSLAGRIATPRMQNRVKVVLSPNFNKPGSMSNSQLTGSPAANSILNSLSGPPSQPSNAANAASAAAVTAPSTVTTPAQGVDDKQLVSPTTTSMVPASLSSPSLQSSFAASKLASVVGSGGSGGQQQAMSSLSQFKANMSRLSSTEPASLLSPSSQSGPAAVGASVSASNTPTLASGPITSALSGVTNAGAGGANTGSPSSSSIFDMLSSNRFLGSRYSMIQQQMQSNKINRHSLGAIPSSSAGSQHQALNTPPEPVHASPAVPSPASSTEKPASGEASDDMVYPKLKESKQPMEGLMNELSAARLLNGSNEAMLKILKSKNIATVGQLCALSSLEALSLPFKVPILENLRAFFQKHEESLMKEKSVESAADEVSEVSTATSTTSNLLGSVEEEMAKLETTNLDTSIETESFSENLYSSSSSSSSSSNASTTLADAAPNGGLNAIDEENTCDLLSDSVSHASSDAGSAKNKADAKDAADEQNSTQNAMDIDTSLNAAATDSAKKPENGSGVSTRSKSPARLKGARTRASVDKSPSTTSASAEGEPAVKSSKDKLSRVRELFESQLCKESFKPEEILAELVRTDGSYNLSWEEERELMEMADDLNSIVNANSIVWRKFLYNHRVNSRQLNKK